MLPISFLAIVFTLSLSAFLSTSFESFKDYNHQIKDFTNWQETSLASAKRVSMQSSNLLSQIKAQLNSCLEEYSAIKDENQKANYKCETQYTGMINDFQTSLRQEQSNQLNSTIKFGLDPDLTGTTYLDYSYELYHSDKLPGAYKKGDELYNSSLVKEDQLNDLINVSNLNNFLDSEKLKISSKLLEDLLGKENTKLISLTVEKFNLILDTADSLSENQLPNAIKININFNKRQSIDFGDSNKKIPPKTLTLSSAGQIKITEGNLELEEPTIASCNTCGCPGVICPPPPSSTPEFNAIREQITFNQFDNISGRGIYFDNSQKASYLNQINLINTDQGRFTSIYPNSNNYLQINIGTITKSSLVLSSSVIRANQTINPKLVDFATVSFEPEPPVGHVLNIVGTNNINVDIVPRARKVYMTAKKDFIVNGQLIPSGSILIGTLDAGSSIINPQLKDLANIRVYDRNTGALKQIFKPEERNSNDCAGVSCMDINQFVSSGSNPSLEASQVNTSFSTADLFSSKNFHEANRLFTLIQRDLEVSSVTAIYSKKYNWQEDILKEDLNAEQQVLLTEVFEKYDTRTTQGRIEIANYLGLSFIRTGEDIKDTLQGRIIDAFVEFAGVKKEFFGKQYDPKLKKTSLELRDKFLAYRSIYQDYLRSSITSSQAQSKLSSLDDKYNNQNDSSATISNNTNTNSTNTKTKPPTPVAPACMAQKAKDRSNKCKENINAYQKALADYKAIYG
jgi:hypothetical protein